MGQKVRLDKLLSNLGYCSRKEVKQWIRDGRLSLGGRHPKGPADKVFHQEVRLDGQVLDPPPPFTLLLHKPAGYACSHDDHPPLVYSLLPERFRLRKPKLSTIGRLDRDTTGVLLITDDGDLLHRLTSPKHKAQKVYQVTTRDPLTPAEAELLASGTLELDGKRLRPAVAKLISQHRLELTLTEGRFHQVKRMLELVGNEVTSLHRSRFAGVSLGELEPGQFRQWTETFS